MQMGLIYVNPEGPNGQPDPVASGRDVRETFARMAMNDEETVALVAGGHTFGKAHGAGDPKLVGPEPEAAPIEEQGLGWINRFGTGKGAHTTTSGIEGAWKPNPTKWDMGYFDMLFGYEWELVKSPAGAWQWLAKDVKPEHMIPGRPRPLEEEPAHDDHGRPLPPLRSDLRAHCAPVPQEPAGVRRRLRPRLVQAHPSRHGAEGPVSRPGSPGRRPHLAGPGPPCHPPSRSDAKDIAELKAKVLASGLSVAELVSTAWASASSFRGSDKRGGANGARIRLAPQKDWDVNQPAQLAKVLGVLGKIQADFNGAQKGGKKISLADLIVLAGCAGG